MLAVCLLAAHVPAAAQNGNGDSAIVEAREAARKHDRPRLAAARAAALAAQHPLAQWVEYWDLSARLKEARVDEVEAFYARWSGSYVEDRLRNDWLLELGRRRDWDNLARDYPRFRMNDDREVSCWWLLTEHLAGRDVTPTARSAWLAQRDADDGCNMLATALVDARRFGADDVWRKARAAVEANRPGVAKVAVALLGNAAARLGADALDNPLRFLRAHGGSIGRLHNELRLLALLRLAASDPDVTATQLDERWQASLPSALAARAWASVGHQAAIRLSTDAPTYYQRGWSLLRGADAQAPGWSDETLAWGVRSALRAAPPRQRWPLVLRSIDAMSAQTQGDPTWVYWKARALATSARDGAHGDAQRATAQHLLESIAGPLGFYAKLAAEDLGAPRPLPAAPAPQTAAELDAARAAPGLTRALMLNRLGLRDEGRREWNFTLRGMTERELLAAARLACDAAEWQLCINTSERTHGEIDTAQRFPTPFSAEITQAATAAGIEPALVYGLIRQETRFMPQLRSSAGARGLMQVMPATARWVARKVGMDSSKPELIADPQVNLKLGTSYLKLVLDDLGGSQAMAAAAYNAGPARPRRWREGPLLEPAIWTENIPFSETRDYVKKVLSNAAVYAALLGQPPPLIKTRLGAPIGPRAADAAPAPALP